MAQAVLDREARGSSRAALARMMPPLGAMIAVLVTVAVFASGPRPALALDGEEARLLELINGYRVANGLGALSLDAALGASARWMAEDMAQNGYLSHTDSLGRDPVGRMAAFGYGYNTWKGENLAAGMATAQEAFDHWKQSPAHNANLLNPNFTVAGIARAFNQTAPLGWYWANDFGGQDSQPPPPAPSALAPPTPEPVAPAPEPAPMPDPLPVASPPAPAPEPATPAPSPSPLAAPAVDPLASAAPGVRWWHIAGFLEPWWDRLTVVGAAEPVLRTASFLAGWYLEEEASVPRAPGATPPVLALLYPPTLA